MAALEWRECPEYLAHLDATDTHDDLAKKGNCTKEKVRSAVDAKRHYQRGKLLSSLLTVLEAWEAENEAKPLKENEVASQRVSSLSSLVSYLTGHQSSSPLPSFEEALACLMEESPSTLADLKAKGLSFHDVSKERIVGNIAAYFGLKRNSVRVQKEGVRARIYHFDIATLNNLRELALPELRRSKARVQAWKVHRERFDSLAPPRVAYTVEAGVLQGDPTQGFAVWLTAEQIREVMAYESPVDRAFVAWTYR